MQNCILPLSLLKIAFKSMFYTTTWVSEETEKSESTVLMLAYDGDKQVMVEMGWSGTTFLGGFFGIFV